MANMMKNASDVWTTILILVLVAPTCSVYGAVHKVDWTLTNDYSTWTTTPIAVGDTMDFSYSAGQHSVLAVSEADYKSCSASNPLSSDSTGKTTIKLSKSGPMYFICGIPGHCPPMKLQINVKDAAASTSSPAGSSSTTPASTTSSSTTPSSTKAASASGDSGSVGVSRLLFGVSIVFGALLGFMG